MKEDTPVFLNAYRAVVKNASGQVTYRIRVAAENAISAQNKVEKWLIKDKRNHNSTVQVFSFSQRMDILV